MARRSREHDEQMLRQIERWFDEAYRMWVNAHNTIRDMERLRQRIIEQSPTLGITHRVAPWVEE